MKAITQILGILVIGIPLLFLSCRKDREVAKYSGEYTITGKVVDKISGFSIPHASVGVIGRSRDATSHFGGKTVAFDKSDDDGNFTLKFSANSEDNNYELTANALTYFTKTSGDDVRFTKNGSRTQNVLLMPYGYLTLHIKGNKGGDKLSVSAGGGGSNYNQGVDTIKTYNKTPGQEAYLVYGAFNQKDELLFKTDTSLLIVFPPDSTHFLIEF